jgi:hypothetical protein
LTKSVKVNGQPTPPVRGVDRLTDPWLIKKRTLPKELRMETKDLIKIAQTLANVFHDGHLTIMKFTTHYKAMFGTPNLDIDGRNEVLMLEGFPTLRKTLEHLILEEVQNRGNRGKDDSRS